jgi:hypothetical protein
MSEVASAEGDEDREPEVRAADPKQAELIGWVDELIARFRWAVEDSDLWRALWDDQLTSPRGEKIVQAIAAQIWLAHCQAADIDISREPNLGCGPVDFKFARGRRLRVLLEVKLLGSTQLRRGALEQLPQYLKTEQIDCGFYVCVGFTDTELTEAKRRSVVKACAEASKHTGRTLIPRFVDARPKLSASRR